MPSELSNLWLFARVIGKVALLAGLGPAILVIVIYQRVFWGGQLAQHGIRVLVPANQKLRATSPPRKVRTGLKYAIKVVQKNGDEDFLRDFPTQRITGFPSYAAAYRQVDFMKIGAAGRALRSVSERRKGRKTEGDVQSINIVKYPKRKAIA